MSPTTKSAIDGRVLGKVHYITFPEQLSSSDLSLLESKLGEWSSLPVEMHVLDLKGLTVGHERFFRALKTFREWLGQTQIASINVSDDLYKEILRLKMDTVFNRIRVFPDDLYPKKQVSDADKKRLLIRHLIRSAYSAVEVALRSTVSCDENYLIKFEKVPFDEFDLVSIVDVRNDFMTAQIRLCASVAVLKKLASAMVDSKNIDDPLIESMAMEMLNLIYGGAKSKLNNDESFRLPSVIPRLLRRAQFAEIKRNPQNISILPLVTPLGSFYVEVDISPV